MKKIGLSKEELMANKDAICAFLSKKGMSDIIGGYGGYINVNISTGYTAYPDSCRYTKTIIVNP